MTVPRLALLARPLFWLALVLALAMALFPHPPQLIEASDKTQHMLAFGTLTVLAAAGYPRVPPWRLGEHLSFAGALIEVLQSIPALHRDCDIMDWVADTAVILGVLLVVRLYRGAGAG